MRSIGRDLHRPGHSSGHRRRSRSGRRPVRRCRRGSRRRPSGAGRRSPTSPYLGSRRRKDRIHGARQTVRLSQRPGERGAALSRRGARGKRKLRPGPDLCHRGSQLVRELGGEPPFPPDPLGDSVEQPVKCCREPCELVVRGTEPEGRSRSRSLHSAASADIRSTGRRPARNDQRAASATARRTTKAITSEPISAIRSDRSYGVRETPATTVPTCLPATVTGTA